MLTGSKKKIQLSRADYLIRLRITNYMVEDENLNNHYDCTITVGFKQKYVLRIHITELTMLIPGTSGDDCCLPGILLRISSSPGSGSGDTLTGPCPPSLSLCRSRSQSPLSRHSLHSRLLLPTSLLTLTLAPDTRQKTLTHQNLRKEKGGHSTRKN